MRTFSTIFTLVLLISFNSTLTAQVNWTKYEGNPILEPGAPGTWNDYSLSPACILFDGSTYQLWYGGSDVTTTRIGYATSPDGKTWIEYENNPIFNPGPAGSWDEWASGSYVLFDGSTYHMWYAGNDGTNTRIGYATAPDTIPIDRIYDVLSAELPGNFALMQNYPNPFNPNTVISLQLAVGSNVDLSIYNVLGQKVVTLVSGKQKPGLHSVEWDASGLASGVYYYRLVAGEFVDCKKLVLLK